MYGQLVAVGGTAATVIVALSLCFGAGFAVLLSPKFLLFNLGTLDTTFAHLQVVFNFSVREFSIFSEYDVEAEQEHTQANYNYTEQNKFHFTNCDLILLLIF